MIVKGKDGNILREGIDYELKDGFIIPYRPIMSISYEKTIESKPNRAQRRHPLKG